MPKTKQLTIKEIEVIGIKGEIANELHKMWETFYRLQSRCQFHDSRELKSISNDLYSLMTAIELCQKEVNIKPIDLSHVHI